MFGLNTKIKNIEKRLLKIEQDKRCASGKHEWQMVEASYYNHPPFIRCPHCYATPEDKQ